MDINKVEPTSYLKTFSDGARQLFVFSVILFVFCFFDRLFEFIMVPEKSLFFRNLLYILIYDACFSLSIFAILLIPGFLIALFSRAAFNVLCIVVYLLIIVLHLGLTIYFYKTNVPLGADFFSYSFDEILLTTKSSGGISVNIFITFMLMLAAFISLLIFLPRYIGLPRKKRNLVIILAVASLFLLTIEETSPESFKSEYDYYLSSNKSVFFISSSLKYLDDEEEAVDLIDDKAYYITTQNSDSVNYINAPDFPFLKSGQYNNTLASFFKPFKQTPNVVVVIMESMGKAYSGKDASLGSFTPFLDSLANHSLSWQNCLSSGGRTFAVLPSVFGSLPFLKQGYLEEGTAAPKATSIIKILNCNGYNSSFYYGSKASFDKMDIFLKQQGATVRLDENLFDKKFSRLPSNSNGFSWGYGDKEVFQQYNLIHKSIKEPRLDIILTVANHSPYLIPNQRKYIEKAVARMRELGVNDVRKKFLTPYLNQLSCVMYADDALKEFITEARKNPQFNNTIFIFTGDHRMTEIPISTQIDRFHVPLLIYSPMLKRSAFFKSVVTHFDITPTLLSYLKNAHQLRIPDFSAWMGSSLDTAKTFYNNRKIPLMRNKNELYDFLDGQYFLSGKTLYQVEDNMIISPVKNEAMQSQVQESMSTYKFRNSRVLKIGSMAPDSLLLCH